LIDRRHEGAQDARIRRLEAKASRQAGRVRHLSLRQRFHFALDFLDFL
jgi:hypothetical protein